MCIGYHAKNKLEKRDKIVTRKFYINCIYALSWSIKHVGNKVWSGSK